MNRVYKIVEEGVWRKALAENVFIGAEIDLKDGYIHLSGESQVETTARLHFSGRDDLLLVAFDAAAFGPSLVWELSRGGALFPHVYGRLVPALALWARPLPWNGKVHVFPEAWRS